MRYRITFVLNYMERTRQEPWRASFEVDASTEGMAWLLADGIRSTMIGKTWGSVHSEVELLDKPEAT